MHQGFLDFDGPGREPAGGPRAKGRYRYGGADAPATDGRTSAGAAAAIRPALSARRAAVYAALLGTGPVSAEPSGEVTGGATADALEGLASLPGNTVRPRLLDLEAQGYARRTAFTRRTRGGNMATIWEAIP